MGGIPARGWSNEWRLGLSKVQGIGDGPLQAGAGLQIKHTSTAEQVAGTLRNAILRGELGPGQAIEESACVETFGISRNTAREAIRELARGGLVVQARRRPATVMTLAAADVTDIFSMRRLLEIGAVDLAAGCDDIDYSALQLAVEELEALSGTSDWRRLGDVDHAFHEAIIALPRSMRLSRTYQSIEAEVRLCLSLTDRWDTAPDDQVIQHQELGERLLAGDWSASKSLLEAHIRDAESRVLKVMEGHESDAQQDNSTAGGAEKNV